MALDDILKMSGGSRDKEVDLSEESVMKHIDKFRELIAYWRLYPDRFIDYLCSLNPKNSFLLSCLFCWSVTLPVFLKESNTCDRLL